MIGSFRPSDHLALYLAEKRYEGVRERTLFGYRDSCERFIAQSGIGDDIRELDASHIYAWVDAMRGRGLRPGGIRSYQLNVWPWLRWLHQQRTLPVDLAAQVKPIRVRDEDRTRRTATESMKAALLKVARDRPEFALRNAALVEVLWGTGVRRTELSHVSLADVDLAAGQMWVRVTKTGKARLVGLTRDAVLALHRYIIKERPQVDGPLFLARGQRPMSTNAIRCVLMSLAMGADVKVSSHDFRRACAARLLRAGVEADNVARQLGHKSLSMSLLYGEEGRDERAIEAFHRADQGLRNMRRTG